MAIARVTITADEVDPKTVSIKAGDVVVWENFDSAIHTVNSTFIASGDILPGASYPKIFNHDGIHLYQVNNSTLGGCVTVSGEKAHNEHKKALAAEAAKKKASVGAAPTGTPPADIHQIKAAAAFKLGID